MAKPASEWHQIRTTKRDQQRGREWNNLRPQLWHSEGGINIADPPGTRPGMSASTCHLRRGFQRSHCTASKPHTLLFVCSFSTSMRARFEVRLWDDTKCASVFLTQAQMTKYFPKLNVSEEAALAGSWWHSDIWKDMLFSLIVFDKRVNILIIITFYSVFSHKHKTLKLWKAVYLTCSRGLPLLAVACGCIVLILTFQD